MKARSRQVSTPSPGEVFVAPCSKHWTKIQWAISRTSASVKTVFTQRPGSPSAELESGGLRVPGVVAAHTCPSCSSNEIARIPRQRAMDYVRRFLGWRLYHCRECRARFYDWPTWRQ